MTTRLAFNSNGVAPVARGGFLVDHRRSVPAPHRQRDTILENFRSVEIRQSVKANDVKPLAQQFCRAKPPNKRSKRLTELGTSRSFVGSGEHAKSTGGPTRA